MSVVLRKLTSKECSPGGLVKIFNERKAGKELNYKALLHFIRSSRANLPELLQVLKSLSLVVALFDKNCEDLYQDIVEIRWELENSEFQNTMVSFLIKLMSSQPFYINRVIDRAMNGLSRSVQPDELIIHHSNIKILQFVSEHLPAHLKFIQQKFNQQFPHKSKPLIEHRTYMRNILQIAKIMPVFFDEVIFTVIEKLVKIDSDVENKSDISPVSELFSFEEDTEIEVAREVELSEAKEKLDKLMSEFLKHMESSTFGGKESEVQMWCKALMVAFNNHLLKAQCHNAPFIVFHFFSLHCQLAGLLLDYFWDTFVEVNNPALVRQIGVMYLAGFANRSKAVSLPNFRKVLLSLGSWCYRYITQNDNSGRKFSHDVFYAASQALFYMFSYRHVELLALPDHESFLRELNLTSLIHAQLNPLRQCCTAVLEVFDRITSTYEVAMCRVVIERNSRSLSSNRYHNEEYPFRPCTLPSISAIIKPYFRDMQCSNSFVLNKRHHKVSENFEDWDTTMSGSSLTALSPCLQAISFD